MMETNNYNKSNPTAIVLKLQSDFSTEFLQKNHLLYCVL